MGTLEKLTCQCCGAALPIPKYGDRGLECSYCGATYLIKKDPNSYNYITVLQQAGWYQKIGAKIAIDEESVRYYPPAMLKKEYVKQLSSKIAEALIPYLNFEEDMDIINMRRNIFASLKIIKDDNYGNINNFELRRFGH